MKKIILTPKLLLLKLPNASNRYSLHEVLENPFSRVESRLQFVDNNKEKHPIYIFSLNIKYLRASRDICFKVCLHDPGLPRWDGMRDDFNVLK
jgi:hypothetical protein